MMNEEIKLLLGNATCLVASTTTTTDVANIISIIASVLASVVTIAYVVYKWYKRAKADGKITLEEVDELIDKVGEEIDKTKH